MLSEEALIILAALVACGALILGAIELKWPSPPRYRIRPDAVAPRTARRARRSALPRHASETPRAPYVRRSPPRVPVEAGAPGEIAPAPALRVPVEAPATIVQGQTVAGDEGPLRAGSVVETCFQLYQARRFDDVIVLGTATLDADSPAPAGERAALWSVVALARQASGDDEGARAALESAITTAPGADRATYQRQLVSLAVAVAQAALAAAASHPDPASEARVTAIREAVAWLDRAQAVTGAAPSVDELRDTAHALLWPACEQVVTALLHRQEFRGARRHLREALADPALPSARAERFRELFTGTFSGEIGQLTAHAIRSVQEARETEALGSLNRAESLLDTIAEEALPPARREEVDRRLWWGYDTLGRRRLEAGQFEEALEPLLRAVRFDGVGPERQAQTRASLVRALDGLADLRALAIRRLADAGDREAAALQGDKLWALVRSASEAGITEQDLSPALAKIQRLIESLG